MFGIGLVQGRKSRKRVDTRRVAGEKRGGTGTQSIEPDRGVQTSWTNVQRGVRQDNWSSGRLRYSWPRFSAKDNLDRRRDSGSDDGPVATARIATVNSETPKGLGGLAWLACRSKDRPLHVPPMAPYARMAAVLRLRSWLPPARICHPYPSRRVRVTT